MGLAHCYNSLAGVSKYIGYSVPQKNIPIHWIGPHKILAMGPCLSDEVLDGKPLSAKLLYLDLLIGLSGDGSKRRLSVARCKLCVNQHGHGGISAGLTR